MSGCDKHHQEQQCKAPLSLPRLPAGQISPPLGPLSLVTWGTTLVCEAVAGTRICGPADIGGSVCAGAADC